jgi:predicted nucleic acid-binding Zn ribbon protein
MEPMKKQCLTCDKPLKGRIDKKFCDDYCRNTYNNQRNSDQNNYVRHINNILRKNRRLLAQQLPDNETRKKLHREKLLLLGFNFKYLTHTYQTQQGKLYYFVYDYGYLPLEQDWLLIVKRRSEL